MPSWSIISSSVLYQSLFSFNAHLLNQTCGLLKEYVQVLYSEPRVIKPDILFLFVNFRALLKEYVQVLYSGLRVIKADISVPVCSLPSSTLRWTNPASQNFAEIKLTHCDWLSLLSSCQDYLVKNFDIGRDCGYRMLFRSGN